MSTISGPRAAVLGPLRDWLRDEALSVGPRVYAHGLPQDASFPAVSATIVGLNVDNTVTSQTLVQFDCWADRGRGAQAEELAADIQNTLLQAVPGTQLGTSTVRLMDASIEGLAPLHDEDDGAARYVVTALVTTKVVT